MVVKSRLGWAERYGGGKFVHWLAWLRVSCQCFNLDTRRNKMVFFSLRDKANSRLCRLLDVTVPMFIQQKELWIVFAFVSRFRILRFQDVEIRKFWVTVMSGMGGGLLGRQVNPKRERRTGIRPSICWGKGKCLGAAFFYFPERVSENCGKRSREKERERKRDTAQHKHEATVSVTWFTT